MLLGGSLALLDKESRHDEFCTCYYVHMAVHHLLIIIYLHNVLTVLYISWILYAAAKSAGNPTTKQSAEN